VGILTLSFGLSREGYVVLGITLYGLPIFAATLVVSTISWIAYATNNWPERDDNWWLVQVPIGTHVMQAFGYLLAFTLTSRGGC
jgi:hypothetical protein